MNIKDRQKKLANWLEKNVRKSGTLPTYAEMATYLKVSLTTARKDFFALGFTAEDAKDGTAALKLSGDRVVQVFEHYDTFGKTHGYYPKMVDAAKALGLTVGQVRTDVRILKRLRLLEDYMFGDYQVRFEENKQLVYNAILRLELRYHICPSMAELADETNLRRCYISEICQALVEDGKLTREDRKHRSFAIVNNPTEKIPKFVGQDDLSKKLKAQYKRIVQECLHAYRLLNGKTPTFDVLVPLTGLNKRVVESVLIEIGEKKYVDQAE